MRNELARLPNELTGKQVYLVIVEDRRSDTEITVFSEPAAAVAYAQKLTAKLDRGAELEEALSRPVKLGCLYHDCLRVVPATVDGMQATTTPETA